jgi:hypothetical protein
MLEFLRGKATDRKLRLFACECAHQLWPRFDGEWEIDPRVKQAIELAEAYLDDRASAEDLRTAVAATQAAANRAIELTFILGTPHGHLYLAAAGYAEAAVVEAVVDHVCDDAFYCLIEHLGITGPEMAVLRCLFNPFRPVTFDPAWRSESSVALAAGIYSERAFDRMPILADALEEAGCDHADVLSHCRGSGPHVRGCWVVDLVLDKA